MDKYPELTIREMKHSDAATACKIVRSSIRVLCIEDHQNDENELTDWLSNKTPTTFETWVQNPETETYIAVIKTTPVGVGGMSVEGEILLNYVKPGWQFHGISKGLLSHMESRLRDLGVHEAKLTSTRTAHHFYKRAGWRDIGMSRVSQELEMHKMLR